MNDDIENGPPSLVMVIDAIDAAALADFWAAALGYRRAETVEQYEVLVPGEGAGGPPLLIQHVDDPKVAKNRMHLDLHVADADAAAERLESLGATRLGSGSIGETRWITMADPEGNEFDVAWDHV